MKAGESPGGRGALYYVLLSGEHPTLPRGELSALLESRHGGEVVYFFDGLALVRGLRDPQGIPLEAGMAKEIGLVHSIVEAEPEEVRRAVEEAVRARGYSRISLRKFKGYSCHITGETLQGIARGKGGGTLRVIVTEGVAVIGEPLAVQDTKALNARRPGKRPFFKPGPLSPSLSRVFVNLSRLRPGQVFLDPFCGTGGFALEACDLGALHCLCGDLSSDMVRGSLVNLRYYGYGDRVTVFWQDSARLPLADESVDAIATDPPYGRSTTTGRRGYSGVVEAFIGEAYRVLRRGGYLVYAGPARYEPWRYALEAGFTVAERYQMYVHSTLTREVVVAYKGE